MKKVKELKKWIELYGEVHAAAEELELAYEYVKEEIITEEEPFIYWKTWSSAICFATRLIK